MYYIKPGKQSKAFLKCLRKAALKGNLPKKYLFKWLHIKIGSVLRAVRDEFCAAFHEIRTVSVSGVICAFAGLVLTSLLLNVCVLHLKVDALQDEKTQLSEKQTELEQNIEDLTSSLKSDQKELASKEEIITDQKNALENSENEKEDIIKNFTQKIEDLDLIGGSASRSSADLSAAKSGIEETEILIRETLGYTETADMLIAKLNTKAEELQDAMDRYPDHFPTIGDASSSFGYRRDPINGETRYHSGTDIGSGMGTPIWAAGKGTVTFTGFESGYGYHICVDHGNGLTTRYAHLSEMLVSVGDTVNKGDLIARMGATGRVTGPHLHFEVTKNGERVNPLDYIG